jgi:hypothetical protein
MFRIAGRMDEIKQYRDTSLGVYTVLRLTRKESNARKNGYITGTDRDSLSPLGFADHPRSSPN